MFLYTYVLSSIIQLGYPLFYSFTSFISFASRILTTNLLISLLSCAITAIIRSVTVIKNKRIGNRYLLITL